MIFKNPQKTPLHHAIDETVDNMMISFNAQANQSEPETIEIIKMIFRRQLNEINRMYPCYAQIEGRKLRLFADEINSFMLSDTLAGSDSALYEQSLPEAIAPERGGFFSFVRGVMA